MEKADNSMISELSKSIFTGKTPPETILSLFRVPPSPTFKSYIEHLPGNLEDLLETACLQDSQHSRDYTFSSQVRNLLESYPNDALKLNIDFHPFSQDQLRRSFSLCPGPIPSRVGKKRKQQRTMVEGESSAKKHKKEKREKKHKKDKEKKEKKHKKDKKEKERKEKLAPTPSPLSAIQTPSSHSSTPVIF